MISNLSILLGILSYSRLLSPGVKCSPEAENLYQHLMRDYQKIVRPVATNEEAIQVFLELKLMQLLGVDEVNQVITTNVKVQQKWKDSKLKWNPADFGGIKNISMPCDSVWLPDLVLYDNAEGDYQITKMTKVYVNYTGWVKWGPPAIYRSYCYINVRYFPYDKQNCTMKFGSWTFDASLMDLRPSRGYEADFKVIPVAMDLTEYKISIEWDILEASAMRNRLVYGYGTYVDITFNLVIRRKPLFYTVNLMIPCIFISFLTIFVFYLPCDSGEKVTLCISILLSLTVFILLLAAIIPPTSNDIPLIGQYLLFTLVLTVMSIALTIVVINVHYRNPSTHKMQPWVRKVFLDWLPKLLLIERPIEGQSPTENSSNNNGRIQDPSTNRNAQTLFLLDREGFTHHRSPHMLEHNPEVQKTIEGINYLVDHVRETTEFAAMVRDWKYIAMVLDRLFLWIFSVVCLAGTGKIVLDAPSLYDRTNSIPKFCDNQTTENPWICILRITAE